MAISYQPATTKITAHPFSKLNDRSGASENSVVQRQESLGFRSVMAFKGWLLTSGMSGYGMPSSNANLEPILAFGMVLMPFKAH